MRRDLDDAETGEIEVSVKSPSQLEVKLLRAINIRDRKDGDFDLLIHFCEVYSIDVTTIDLLCQSSHFSS